MVAEEALITWTSVVVDVGFVLECVAILLWPAGVERALDHWLFCYIMFSISA